MVRSTGKNSRTCSRAMVPAIANDWNHVGARMTKANGCEKLLWPMPRSSALARRRPREELNMDQQRKQWPLYEVFIRARAGLEHKHVGSIHAVDERMAIEHARDVYTRRQEGEIGRASCRESVEGGGGGGRG